MGRVIGTNGLELIKDFEGLRLEAYQCSADVWTIGWGHTNGVKEGQSINEAEAERLLAEDLRVYEEGVASAVNLPLSQNEFDALVSFSFNVGLGAFRSSTLLKVLNEGDRQEAAEQLLRWNKVGKTEVAGLTRRRQAERSLFLEPVEPEGREQIYFIEAQVDTWLKVSMGQAADLPNDKKQFIPKGTTKGVVSWGDSIQASNSNMGESEMESENGHEIVELAANSGTRYIFLPHWKCPWHKVSKNTPGVKRNLPTWDEVNWNDFNAPVSQYFTVGEVTNMSRERIPTGENIKKNIIMIARAMDNVREWWGGPLVVTSWNRPWHINRRIGSRAPNHPMGLAVDFKPINGSVYDLQKRFKEEWYDTGKWNGGLGLGAKKGFVHLDLRSRRVWNY